MLEIVSNLANGMSFLRSSCKETASKYTAFKILQLVNIR